MSIWRSFLNRFQLSREPIQEPPQVSQIVPDVGPALKLGNRPQILDDASQPSPRQSVEFRDDGGHHTQADLASQKAPISPRNRDLNTCALRFVAELVKISENSERADLSLPTRAVLE